MPRHGSAPYSLPNLRRGFDVGVHSLSRVPLNVGSPAARLPEYRRDYLRLAAWLFAVLFGPAIIALCVILATGA
jgi:hypothetical protein